MSVGDPPHLTLVPDIERDRLRDEGKLHPGEDLRADHAARLVKLTAAIAAAVTEDEVFEAVVDNLAGAVDASSAALWVLHEDRRTVQLARSFRCAAAAGRNPEPLFLDGTESSPVLDAIRRGEPVWIASQAFLPLIAQGRILGVLGLILDDAAATSERAASEEDQGFLLLLAWYAAQALERLRLLASERERHRAADAAAAHFGILSRASQTFVTADFDLGKRVKEIAREIGAAVGGCIAISLIDRTGQLLTTAVHHPIREAQYALETLVAVTRLRVAEGVTATVARTGESAFVPSPAMRDIASDRAAAYRAFLGRYPSYAMICAPLRVGDTIIGTVTATRVRADETYTRQDLRFLEELADRAAPAIENSRLHDENVAALSRAEQLYQFAKAVVSSENLEDVFEAALDAIERGLGATRGAILISDQQGVMRFRASRNLSAEYRAAVEGHSPWTRDAVAPKPVLVADVETDRAMQPFLPLFQHEHIRSLAFIPLVTHGRLIGKFMVYFGDRHAYTSQEIDLASAIAHHLASVTSRFAAIAKLEETVRYNELFAGVLAHDLRNPLGAIMTAAQLVLMRRGGRDEGAAKPLTKILASGTRMFRMIDQLLDVTRARMGGGIHLDPRATNLAHLCDQAIDELELANPKWTIRREAVGDLNGGWDPDRLLQIISNLVSNAGQHGDRKSPIGVSLDGTNRDTVTLEVRNEGVIPDEMKATLFDPLMSAAPRRDGTRGLGLGLFIVKELVEAHGGGVRVASSAGAGTTFTVTLPRRSSGSAAFEPAL